MCYEYIYCCCCYSYGCCCLVFGALSCGKRSKSHLGAKDNRNIRAYPSNGDRMWVRVRVPPKHLKTNRSYRCIVWTVGSLWWSRCVLFALFNRFSSGFPTPSRTGTRVRNSLNHVAAVSSNKSNFPQCVARIDQGFNRRPQQRAGGRKRAGLPQGRDRVSLAV